MFNKRLFVLLFLFLLNFSFVISEEIIVKQDLGIVRQGRPVELLQGCNNNTALCDSCNITTVTLVENSTVIVSDVGMTRRAGDFNYTLTANQVETLGDYLVNGFCQAGGEFKVWSYNFKITKTGRELSISQAVIYIVFLGAAIGMFLICLWGSLKIPWGHSRNADEEIVSVNDLRFVKIFLIGVTYVMLMFIFGILYNVSDSFLFLTSATNFFFWIFWVLLSFMYPLIVLVFIVAFVVFLHDKRIRDALERGMPVR